MIYFLLGILLMTGCSMKSFIRSGYAPYCLVDYEFKVVDCSYPTMYACRDQYQNHKVAVCFKNKDLKLKKGN